MLPVCCVTEDELMHVSDSTVRWCGGLCLPLHGGVPSTSTWCHLGGSYVHSSSMCT